MGEGEGADIEMIAISHENESSQFLKGNFNFYLLVYFSKNGSYEI